MYLTLMFQMHAVTNLEDFTIKIQCEISYIIMDSNGLQPFQLLCIWSLLTPQRRKIRSMFGDDIIFLKFCLEKMLWVLIGITSASCKHTRVMYTPLHTTFI